MNSIISSVFNNNSVSDSFSRLGSDLTNKGTRNAIGGIALICSGVGYIEDLSS